MLHSEEAVYSNDSQLKSEVHKDSKEKAKKEHAEFAHIIGVPMVFQNPELPTGCEVTALTMVLLHLGFDVDKCELAEDYLPKGQEGKVDFHYAFVGTPENKHAYGCYAPAIVKTATRYLEDMGKEEDYQVTDLTDSDLDELFSYVDQGIPVLVWGTIDNKESYLTTKWVVNGKEITWRAEEHCRVLTGYSKQMNTVEVNDPEEGTITYDMDIFEERYIEMDKQAVVVCEK